MASHVMDSQFNFRMSTDDRQLIEGAARFLGLKPNTYARKRLREAAHKDLEEALERRHLVLSEKEWDHFMAIIEAPIPHLPKLEAASRRFKQAHAHR